MKRISTLSALALSIGLVSPVFAGGSDARIRVVHASPDAPNVDVLVNGAVAFADAPFKGVTDYATLPAGAYDVEVVPAGASAPVVIDLTGPNAVNLFYNRDYTAVAVNFLDRIEPLLLEDDNRPVGLPFSRVRFVHASPDAPAVDIKVADGPYLFRNVAFKGVGDYVTVPRGTYDLEVRAAGTETVALRLPGIALAGGTTYTVFAVGLLSGAPALDAVVRVDAVSPARGRAPVARR
ncbi:MAG TPA: DUF4397 domain-containing protein [Candidatus Polarisedimenticolaceae bacterium]